MNNRQIAIEQIILELGEPPICLCDKCQISKTNVNIDPRYYLRYKRLGYPKFIVGHNKPMKGHKQSEKQKKIVSKCSSDYMNQPEIKEKYSKISSEYHNRPEVKESTSKIFSEYANRPEVRQKTSIRQSRLMNDLEHKEYMREIVTEYANRPEVKEKTSKTFSEYNNRQEVKEKLIKRNIENNPMKNLNSRNKMINSLTGMKLHTENHKQKLREDWLGSNNPMNNPEVRAKVSGKNSFWYGKQTPHGKKSYSHTSPIQGEILMFRWEELYATYLESIGEPYLYEPKTFELILNSKPTTYTPDFFLLNKNKYVEIKGYWRDDSKPKYNTFKNQYPDIKIDLLMKEELNELGINLKKEETNLRQKIEEQDINFFPKEIARKLCSANKQNAIIMISGK